MLKYFNRRITCYVVQIHYKQRTDRFSKKLSDRFLQNDQIGQKIVHFCEISKIFPCV